jgi:hypothetical protein
MLDSNLGRPAKPTDLLAATTMLDGTDVLNLHAVSGELMMHSVNLNDCNFVVAHNGCPSACYNPVEAKGDRTNSKGA